MLKPINLLLLLFLSGFCFSQELVTFKRVYDIQFRNNQSVLELITILPQNIPDYQEIIGIECSHQPEFSFFKGKDKFYRFKLTAGNFGFEGKLTIKITAIVYPNDFGIARRRNKNIFPEEDLSPYLKKGSGINLNDKKLNEAAAAIEGENREAIVRKIFDYVVDTMTYKNFVNEKRSASRAIRQGLGDCTEYSELMIALCRLKGIPARIVGGAVLENRKNANHNWVQVYFDEYGWVPFDPTYAEGARTTFDYLSAQYLYYTNERDLYFYSYKWTGSPVSVEIKFRRTNPLADTEREIDKHFRNEQYDSALLKLDSLLGFGLINFKYTLKKARILLEKEQPKKALSLLQFATKKSEGKRKKDKSDLYLTWAIYLVQVGQSKAAIKYVENALNQKAWGYDILFKNKYLKRLNEFEEFTEITKEKRKAFEKGTGLYEHLIFGVDKDWQFLRPSCKLFNPVPSEDLAKILTDLVHDHNIKKATVKAGDITLQEFEYNIVGTIARYKLWWDEELINDWKYSYIDKRLTKILLDSKSRHSEKVNTSVTEFQYKNNCLAQIDRKVGENRQPTIKVRRDTGNLIRVEEFLKEDSLMKARNYFFDERENLSKISMNKNEVEYEINYAYSADNQLIEFKDIVDGEIVNKTDFTYEKGLLTNIQFKKSETTHIYNDNNQLIQTIYKDKDFSWNKFFYYNKKGLLIAYGTGKENKLSKKDCQQQISYEFY